MNMNLKMNNENYERINKIIKEISDTKYIYLKDVSYRPGYLPQRVEVTLNFEIDIMEA